MEFEPADEHLLSPGCQETKRDYHGEIFYELAAVKCFLYAGESLINNTNMLGDSLVGIADPDPNPGSGQRPGQETSSYVGQNGAYDDSDNSGSLQLATAGALGGVQSVVYGRNSLGHPTNMIYYTAQWPR